MIFQALGSNYSWRSALQILCARGNQHDTAALKDLLVARYGGDAVLYAKGRYALSEAVRIATDTSAAPGVAINALTCSVVVDAVVAATALPRYTDVTEHRCHYDASSLSRTLQRHTDIGTIIVQNTFGEMIDIRPIEALAKKHSLIIIEDLAHCLGQTYLDGREAGTVGDIAMFSFGRDKVIDAVNGGALVIRNPKLRRLLMPPSHQPPRLEQYRDRVYPIITTISRALYRMGVGKILLAIGFRLGILTRSAEGNIDRTLSLPDWQARRICHDFLWLEQNLAHRRSITQLYSDKLGSSLLSPQGTLRAVVRVDDQRAMWKKFRQHSAELDDTWYDTPIGPARKFQQIDYPSDECPHAVQLCRRVINLPTHRHTNRKHAAQLATIAATKGDA